MRRFDHEWSLLVALRPWLGEHGYRLLESRGPEGMDQGYDEYRGERLDIRVIADRSQWFVELGPVPRDQEEPRWDHWFDLEHWSACLGAPVLFHRTLPTDTEDAWLEVIRNSWWLEPQLEFLKSHLGEIERACDESLIGRTVACLKAAREHNAPFPSRSHRRKGDQRQGPGDADKSQLMGPE